MKLSQSKQVYEIPQMAVFKLSLENKVLTGSPGSNENIGGQDLTSTGDPALDFLQDLFMPNQAL